MSTFSQANIDPAVVARAMGGDMRAHALIYRAYSVPVYSLAVRMTGCCAVADDILQETFLEVIRSLRNFREQASLATWIRRVAVSKCLMHHRSAWQRRTHNETDSGAETALQQTQATAERPDLQRDLEQALACLPTESRAVVLMHDLEGMTHEEIARVMNRTVSYSKSRLARAHRILRECLDSSAPESTGNHLRAVG